MNDQPCPRCGKSPVEITTMAEREPRYIPPCACYPHPPQCVTCGTTLDDQRCPCMSCPVYDVLQPAPDTDPLWESMQ